MTIGVAILGSTGSIGTSALNVLARQRDAFNVVALTAHTSRDLLATQAKRFDVRSAKLVAGTGPDVLIEAATHPDAQIVINAVVGAAGLDATLAALAAGKRVALANKESLVMAGELMLRAACEGGGELVPVDSEHSGVLQCISGHPGAAARLMLTASGGPFREWPAERVRAATVAEALTHPTWKMGRKITVDSATLANKALEVIEAHYLFGVPYDQIEVVVHPQSIVHAFVEFIDGSILAQVGVPSMELPILYALTHPERRADSEMPRYHPVRNGSLTFEEPRHDVFPALRLGVDAGRAAGIAPAVFNAANEVAVHAFLAGRIPFGRVSDVVASVLDEHEPQPAADLAMIRTADRWARDRAEARCS
ncbi:MAG TPA: 1-deoxy-D-xylulose-5-phosphate reductoisomerase [Gemmatimonadales bacterium]